MAQFLIETNPDGSIPTENPRYYGPLLDDLFIRWIAYEQDCNGEFAVRPEVEFPSGRHYRPVCWLAFGVRGDFGRGWFSGWAVPRGIVLRLLSNAVDPGIEPPGLIDSDLQCWSTPVDPDQYDIRLADYSNNPGIGAAAKCTLQSELDGYNYEQLSDVYRHYPLLADVRLVDEDGVTWRIQSLPTLNPTTFPPDAAPVEAFLSTGARDNEGNKPRLIWWQDPDVNFNLVGTNLLPLLWSRFFEDQLSFLGPRYGLVSWESVLSAVTTPPTGSYILDIRNAGFGLTSAQAISAPTTPIDYTWRFFAENRTPFISSIRIVTGQTLGFSFEQNLKGLMDISWSIDGNVVKTFVDMPRWDESEWTIDESVLVMRVVRESIPIRARYGPPARAYAT